MMIEYLRGLPHPTVDQLTHSERLLQHIRTEINQSSGGCISFARFMELALYTPGLGYYSAGLCKLGQGGDFVTAPELSPLLARCLATQCQIVLDRLASQGVILELGAGTGRMAADLLLALERRACLPKSYKILEISAELRQRQQHNLRQWVPHLAGLIQHLDSLPIIPIQGVILANEVVDAFPVHKFLLRAGLLQEIYVGWEQHRLVWKVAAPSSDLMAQRLEQLRTDYLQGLDYYESELNLTLPAWITSLSDVLAQGLILLIDYGFPRRIYYHPSRYQGTIMCHYRHHAHTNPLLLVGLQDITASVDFTAIAEAAVSTGLKVLGFASQGAFLIGCGILELSCDLYADLGRSTVNRWVKQLTCPSEMGEFVKVLALGRGDSSLSLPGFAGYNRRWCL